MPPIPTSIPVALDQLRKATCPEALFGKDPSVLKEAHRAWIKVVHEDRAPTVHLKTLAHEAFLLLTKWVTEAEARMGAGTYGAEQPVVIATLQTKTCLYTLRALVSSADPISDWYSGTSDKGALGGVAPVLVRVGRSPINNDLLKREADVLAVLPATLLPKHAVYFPSLLDSFEAEVGGVRTRVNVFSPLPEGAVSLSSARAAYPEGIKAPDAAWMWNRLIEALHLLHTAPGAAVHGAIVPSSFYIVPETHRGVLLDFAYSVPTGLPLKAIQSDWRALYPEEALAKKALDPSSDLYMAAGVLDYLLSSKSVPPPIAQLSRACRLGRAHRIAEAKVVHQDFAKVLRRLYGPKRFRVFAMPPQAKAEVAPV